MNSNQIQIESSVSKSNPTRANLIWIYLLTSLHPSLNKLFLVEIKPVGLDIPNFFQILRQVALFQPLDAPIEGLLVC
jgi:hypothetical protein